MAQRESGLTPAGRQALQMIYDRFRERGSWAIFADVDRPLRRLGLQPEVVLGSIPRDLLLPFQSGRAQPIARDELRLSLKGLAVCAGGQEDIDVFLRLLPWLAERELAFTPDEGTPDTSVRVRGDEIREFLQLPEEAGNVIRRLQAIISLQRWGWTGGELAAGEWYVQVDREIYRFAQVKTLDDYFEAERQWDAQSRPPQYVIPDDSFSPSPKAAGVEDEIIVELDTYVSAAMVAALEAAAITQARWNCDKLIRLIGELNDNFARDNTYSAHAILRAILDHIPPILGYTTFNEVVSNYPWTQTDRKYMRRLLEFKDQAHDVLHRRISTSADPLDMQDMPQRAAVNRLLLTCADKLKTVSAQQS